MRHQEQAAPPTRKEAEDLSINLAGLTMDEHKRAGKTLKRAYRELKALSDEVASLYPEETTRWQAQDCLQKAVENIDRAREHLESEMGLDWEGHWDKTIYYLD